MEYNLLNSKDLILKIMEKEKEPYIVFKSYPQLSDKLGIRNGETITIAGETGYGKSAFVLNLINDAIQMKDTDVCYFNLEMSDRSILKRLTAIELDINCKDVNVDKVLEYCDTVISTGNNLIINDTNDINEIIQRIIEKSNDGRKTLYFIDHIGVLRDNLKYFSNRQDEVKSIMDKLRRCSKTNDVNIFIVSQLNRSNKEQYSILECPITSFAESSSIEQYSTICLFIGEEKQRGKRKKDAIAIKKNRDGENNVLIEIMYSREKQTIKELYYDFNLTEEEIEKMDRL